MKPIPKPTAAGPVHQVSAGQFLQIFSAVMLPMFLAAIDQTVLATATPAIAAELGGLRDTTWIALGYLMATTVMAPLYGRLGDRYGRRDMLFVAVGVFALGSAACGLAQAMGQLIGARVLQGLGGGGLMVMSQALINELVPARERPRFQGYFAAVFTLASIAGPVVGGLVVSHASWRWLFLVNLPFAAFAAWRVARLPRRAPDGDVPALTDWRAVALFVATTACTLIWVTFAGHRFALVSPASGWLVAGALVFGTFLVVHERRAPAPFLPIELLRIGGIGTMSATVVSFAACFFACVFFLPIYLQVGLGVTAKHAGLLLLPVTLGMVIGATLTGRVAARTAHPKPMPVFGLGLATLALGLLGALEPSTTRVMILGVVCGIGFGAVMPTAQLVIPILAGRARLGAAAAVVSLSRSVGAALGTAVFGALVFALLRDVDLDAALRAGSAVDPARVIHAFRVCFMAMAGLAAIGAAIALRLPAIDLSAS